MARKIFVRTTANHSIYSYDQWKFRRRKSAANLTLMDAIGFTEEDLEANRNEYITKKQRMRLDRERNSLKSLTILAILACLVGIVIAIWVGIIGLIISIMATGNGIHTWLKMKDFSADLYKGEVSVISGQVKIHSQWGRGLDYSIKIQNVNFSNAPYTVFQAFEANKHYNIFYAPHSKMIFSAERF